MYHEGTLNITFGPRKQFGALYVAQVNVRDPNTGEFLEHFEVYRPEDEDSWKPWLHDITSPYRKNLRREAVKQINAVELWERENVPATG